MKTVKRTTFVSVLVVGLTAPAFSLWWNPFTWNEKKVSPNPVTITQKKTQIKEQKVSSKSVSVIKNTSITSTFIPAQRVVKGSSATTTPSKSTLSTAVVEESKSVIKREENLKNKNMYFIFSTGQSNSNGTFASPALSTKQPYSNFKVFSNTSTSSPEVYPLTEEGVETPSSGLANSLSAYQATGTSFIVGLHGAAGAGYIDLKIGSEAYSYGISQLYAAKKYAELFEGTLAPLGVTVIHGESDWDSGRTDSYEQALIQWQNDYEKDTMSILGISNEKVLPMFISQTAIPMKNEMGVKQLSAHKNNPGRIILIGPAYQYKFGPDSMHMTDIDSRQSGELFAKVINQVVFKGERWDPLMPVSISRERNIIFVTYHVPVGQITIDTKLVAKRKNYGFAFSQTGGEDGVFIEDVKVVGASKLAIRLNKIPTGTDQRLRYAYTCSKVASSYNLHKWCGGRDNPDFAGGNIRDTDTRVSPAVDGTGLPLYDWGVAFDEPVSDSPQ